MSFALSSDKTLELNEKDRYNKQHFENIIYFYKIAHAK